MRTEIGVSCCRCLRVHQVKSPVYRLHSQAVGQAFLQVTISSSPFLVSTPFLHTIVHRQTLCKQEGRSWRMSTPERKGEGCFDGQIDRLIVFCQDHTVVQQVIVEDSRRRKPQHPPLHTARDINVIFSMLPASQTRIQKSTRDFPALKYIPSFDCLHHRVLFLVSEDIHVLLAIADDRLGVNPHECCKPPSNLASISIPSSCNPTADSVHNRNGV